MRNMIGLMSTIGRPRGNHKKNWQHPDRIPCPTAFSSTSEWHRAARYAPEQLLQLVKRFALPGELLKSLDASVMVQWMTERRRDCLSEGLNAYRQQPLDFTMQTWLDGWIERN